MAIDVTDDGALMEHLRALAAVADPVPDEVVLAGRSAIAHRDMELRLAELVEESALAGAGTRGDEEPWFSFEVDDVVVELAIRTRDGQRRVVGQVDGATAASVTVRQGSEASPADLDELGRFASPVGDGPLRVEFTLEDGRRVTTSWVLPPRG